MKVARLHGIRDVRVTDEPAPAVPDDPGLSLVEVTAVGLCGSDLHWYTEGGIGDAVITRPLVGGHEFAGLVRGGPLDGRRVAVDPAIPCGVCDMCLAGDRNLCRHIRFAGHSDTDGGLQQSLVWPTSLLYPLDDRLSDSDGAMLEPLGVAIHAFDLGHVALGSTVAVFGCGPIGLCLLQVARAGGAGTVIAVEPLEHRRAAAQRLGADVVLSPDSPDLAAGIAAATDGRGVDVVFEAAGNDGAIAAAVEAARPGARVVLAGIPSTEDSAFPASTARRKGLTLVMVRRMKEVYPRAMALVAAGLVDIASVVTHHVPLTRVDDAFQAAVGREGLKVVVHPTGHGSAAADGPAGTAEAPGVPGGTG